jgi:hypothetical protein
MITKKRAGQVLLQSAAIFVFLLSNLGVIVTVSASPRYQIGFLKGVTPNGDPGGCSIEHGANISIDPIFFGNPRSKLTKL